MAHARNLLEQPLAPTVRIEERVRYGSPTAGICFNTAERSWIRFVAAMRHRQYKAIARTRFPQLRRARTTRVSPATTPRENNRPKRRPASTTAARRQCRFGSPTAGICFSRHSDFGFGCVAALRHDSYTYDCRSKVPPTTKGLPKQSTPQLRRPAKTNAKTPPSTRNGGAAPAPTAGQVGVTREVKPSAEGNPWEQRGDI